MITTRLKFQTQLPSLAQVKKLLGVKKVVVIYDQKIKSKNWLAQFESKLSVRAGEKLKQLSSFERLSKRVLREIDGCARNEVALLAVGGGSVGDFTGFLASVLKRGIIFGNIPSTWLAAVDSAHGGKNALNLGGAKNQLGTFYPAKAVWLCKNLLESSGNENASAAMGEVIKMAVIAGGREFAKFSAEIQNGEFQLWKSLPALIKAKMRVVEKDFDESNGLRHILNLGHTMGHIIEADNRLTHGKAVLLGLRFTLEWSKKQKLIGEKDYLKIRNLIDGQNIKATPVKASKALRLLKQDKKNSTGRIRFVFIRRPGQVLIQRKSAAEVVQEGRRQGVIS